MRLYTYRSRKESHFLSDNWEYKVHEIEMAKHLK